MNKQVIIHLASSQMKFAAGHFTLFSATKRENIHGHNFTITANIKSKIGKDGLAFDYQIFKKELAKLCAKLDEKLLLPGKSPYLKIKEQGEYIAACFAEEVLLFLPRDVYILPIANISVENLAQYFLSCLVSKKALLKKYQIENLVISVASSPSQSGEACWCL